MFARLWFHGFIGCNHQENRFDARRTGKHVADKAFVAGHIDKTQALAARQHQRREAKINRNAAPLLFGQTIGILTSEGADKRSFPVIDVPGCADNESRGHEIV